MPHHGQIASDDEVKAAGFAGLRGAVVGAARWGIYSAILGAGAFYFSPVYRGLTVQFKVFLQMSGMTFGSVIEAERRMRDYETTARRIRKLNRDQEAWTIYEKSFQEDETREKVDQKDDSRP